MRAGPLRQLVTIQRPAVQRDDRGEESLAWSDVASTWAELEPTSGRERHAAMKTVAETTWTARMRWVPGLEIRTSDRLDWRGQSFAVLAVRNVMQRNRMIEIELKEHQA